MIATVIDDSALVTETEYVQATTEALSILADGKADKQILREGDPVKVLPELSQELGADSIAIGLKRHNEATGLLLGSRADRLLRSSPVPILSIPSDN